MSRGGTEGSVESIRNIVAIAWRPEACFKRGTFAAGEMPHIHHTTTSSKAKGISCALGSVLAGRSTIRGEEKQVTGRGQFLVERGGRDGEGRMGSIAQNQKKTRGEAGHLAGGLT